MEGKNRKEKEKKNEIKFLYLKENTEENKNKMIIDNAMI